MRAGMLEAWLTTQGLDQGAGVFQSLGLDVELRHSRLDPCPTSYLRSTVVTVFSRANSSGRASHLLARIPNRGELPEMSVAAQAGYRDPKTGKLRLTDVTETSLPAPAQPYSFHRVFYMASSPTATEGVFLDHQEQPVFRYS